MAQYPSHIEHKLLTGVAEGNEQDFRTLLGMMAPALALLVKKIVKSDDVVQEIMQESFLRIWINRDKLPALEFPIPWFKRLVLNETFTWLNKNAKRSTLFPTYENTAGPLEALAFKETQALLHKAIENLPAQRKRIYTMNRVQGKTISEIAAELNVTTGYVKNTLSAALESIRSYLVKAGRAGFLLMVIFFSE